MDPGQDPISPEGDGGRTKRHAGRGKGRTGWTRRGQETGSERGRKGIEAGRVEGRKGDMSGENGSKKEMERGKRTEKRGRRTLQAVVKERKRKKKEKNGRLRG